MDSFPVPIPVILANYNPAWPEIAANHSARLLEIGASITTVHHIGSTAVPGLAAKPIIDLMPLVVDLAALDQQRPRIAELGYKWHGEGGIEGRRYCTLSDQTGVRIVQLHIFQTDSWHVKRHLAFRDYLLAHSNVANAYETEKRRAQRLHPTDSHAYSDEKGAWIRAAEIKAIAWYTEKYPNGSSSTGSILDR